MAYIISGPSYCMLVTHPFSSQESMDLGNIEPGRPIKTYRMGQDGAPVRWLSWFISPITRVDGGYKYS